jgi:type I restriction enzyme S subunit
MSKITALLGEVTEIISGTTPESAVAKYWNGEFVWVTPTDLGKNSDIYFSDSERKITEAGLKSCNLKKVSQGAIVMSSRAPIGHLAIAGCELYTNQGCKSFVPFNDVLDSEFLFYLLSYRMPDIQALGSGATFLEVSKASLENLEITFPKSLTAQKQIGTKLKAQLAEVETARKALEMQLQDIKNLVSQLKNQMFLKLEDAERVPFGDLLIGIEAGKSFQTLETLAQEDEIGVIKLSAISWGCFNPREAKAISNDYLPDDRHRICKGDLIISRANTLELVGAVVKSDQNYPNRLLSDKTLRLVFDQNQVESDYLLYALRWPEARKHIEANATGTRYAPNPTTLRAQAYLV